MSDTPWLWIPRPRPAARLRLVCLGPAGAGASSFGRWPALAPPEIEVAVVSLPGREGRLDEPAIDRFDALIDALSRHVPLDPPYALYGHSLGGQLAFTLAQRASARPAWLGLGACRPPSAPRSGPPLSSLDDATFLLELERRYNGIPAMLHTDKELQALFLPSLRADYAVLESRPALPGPPLDVRARLYAGERDPDLRPEHLRGWDQHLRPAPPLDVVPGDHFFLRTPEGAARVLTRLSADLGLAI